MDNDDRMRFAAGETEQLPPPPKAQPADEDADKPLPEPPSDED